AGVSTLRRPHAPTLESLELAASAARSYQPGEVSRFVQELAGGALPPAGRALGPCLSVLPRGGAALRPLPVVPRRGGDPSVGAHHPLPGGRLRAERRRGGATRDQRPQAAGAAGARVPGPPRSDRVAAARRGHRSAELRLAQTRPEWP